MGILSTIPISDYQYEPGVGLYLPLPVRLISLPVQRPEEELAFFLRNVRIPHDLQECWRWMWKFSDDGYPLFTFEKKIYRALRYLFETVHGRTHPDYPELAHNCPTGDDKLCISSFHLIPVTRSEHGQDRKEKGQMPSGDNHFSRMRPEKLHRGPIADTTNWKRGDAHWTRTTPEKMKIGDDHWTHQRPELVARGDATGVRKHPESRPRGDDHHARRTPEVIPRGTDFPQSKLDEDKVREIRRLYATGNYTQKQLAEMFGVTQHLICLIIHRKAWAHVK